MPVEKKVWVCWHCGTEYPSEPVAKSCEDLGAPSVLCSVGDKVGLNQVLATKIRRVRVRRGEWAHVQYVKIRGPFTRRPRWVKASTLLKSSI